MAHSPARTLDVGSVIAGTYTIEGLIGKGGMGAVFVASHARLPGKKVAIKVLHPDIADGDALARFRREAEIASRLGHPNIVEVHDWNQLPDGTPYIVYELLQGESLADRLRRGPMSFDEIAGIVRQVGSALAAAHREHIVHRDLKPQNIFLVQADDGVSVKAKILDFGISKIRGSTTVKTQDTAMLGTPQYMAPEQATGRHDDVDGRTDVFALGAVVFEMFAGAPAFAGSTIPEVVFKVVYEEAPDLAARAPAVPPHVAAAVARALAKKPAERWDDVATFVEALTGSPLTSGRRSLVPGIGAATGGPGPATGAGAGRDAGGEAFAATVGSGDHASAMAASVRASMAAAQTVAGTAQSGNGAVSVPPPPATVDQPAPAPPRSTRTVMLVMVTVVVVAAGVVFAVMAGGKGDGQEAVARRGAAPGSAAGSALAGGSGTAVGPGTAAGAGSGTTAGSGSGSAVGSGSGTAAGSGAAMVADAGVDAAAAPAIDAGPRKPRVDAGVATAPPDPPDSPDEPDDEPGGRDPELLRMLGDAQAALGAGDHEEALRIAKKITNEHPRSQPGWAIRTRANCGLDDQEAARAAFQRVRKAGLQRVVRKSCRAAGIDL